MDKLDANWGSLLSQNLDIKYIQLQVKKWETELRDL